MKKTTFLVGLGAMLVAPLAIAQGPGGSDELIDQLTQDLNPALAEVAPRAQRAQRADTPAPIRQRTAPATPPELPRLRQAHAPAPAAHQTPNSHQPADAPVGTPLSEATERKAGTPLGKATRDDAKQASGTSSWAMVGLALIALFAVAVWLKRRSNTNSTLPFSPDIETLSTARIFGKHMVGLVKVGDRVLLVGYSDKGLTLLTELDEAELVTASPAMPQPLRDATPKSFVEKIAAMRQGWKPEADPRDPFQEALEADAPAEELVRMDERAAIRERLEALRRRSIAVA